MPPHLRGSPFPEALLGDGLSSFPRATFPATGGELSRTLSRPFVSAAFVRQAHCTTHRALATEVWHRPRRPSRSDFCQEMAGTGIRRATGAVLRVRSLQSPTSDCFESR